MASPPRVPKTQSQRLRDLDDHLFLLREGVQKLERESAHLKAIAAELRLLVCISSGTEGLLWRLADDLQVSDVVHLHCACRVDKSHPLAEGLHFMVLPVWRAGQGDPRLVPDYYSLREIIKDCHAVVISGCGLTHEYLIKAIAQQMGSAHEDDGIEPALRDLGQIFFNGIEPYVQILARDADLALEIGDRVLDHTVANGAYRRKIRKAGAEATSINQQEAL
jgi:hypothetical protein